MKKHIESESDLDGLIVHLLPARLRSRLKQHSDVEGIRHATKSILEMLWDDGLCGPIHIDRICKEISRRHEWQEGMWCEPQDLLALRRRLQRRILRLSDGMRNSPWGACALIRYDRGTSTYRLVLSESISGPSKVKRRVKRAGRGIHKAVEIEIIAQRFKQGRAALRVGDLLSFSLISQIAGYVHVALVDAGNIGHLLFPKPEIQPIKRRTVRSSQSVVVPGDILKEEYRWEIEGNPKEATGKEKVIVVVCRNDVTVTLQDLLWLGFEMSIPPCRGVRMSGPSFRELQPGSIAIGSADYYLLDR